MSAFHCLSRLFLFASIALFIVGGSAHAVPVFLAGGPGEGSGGDLLNHGNGTRLAGSTGMHDSCCGVSNARAAIGFSSGSFVEPLHATFQDSGVAGQVDSITFMTLNPVTASSFDLRLADDGAGNFRMASAFSIEASKDGISFTTISSSALPVYDGLTISDAAPVLVADAQFFRVNVTRAGSGGVRIHEFDVFGTVGSNRSVTIDPNLLNALTNGAGDEPAGLSTNFVVSSAVGGTDTPQDAFGNNDGTIEGNSFIFADGRTPDNNNSTIGDGGESVDFIQWTTTQTVTLAGLELLLAGDGEGVNARGAEMIRIFVEGIAVDTYDNNRDGIGNGGNALVRIFQGGPVSGDDFRIEFTHKTGAGARILEINAIVPVPEPAALSLLSLAGLTLLRRRSRA